MSEQLSIQIVGVFGDMLRIRLIVATPFPPNDIEVREEMFDMSSRAALMFSANIIKALIDQPTYDAVIKTLKEAHQAAPVGEETT